MEKICEEILNKWAKYVKYDENQTSFNLLTYDYEAHKRTEALSHIIDNYDETGLLAVITVKQLFYHMMNNTRISLEKVINSPEEILEHIEMRNLFNSPEIKKAENLFIERIKSVVLKVIGKELLGNFDDTEFSNRVFTCIDNVIKSIDKCTTEFYQKGRDFTEITNISTNIHVFNSLAECLMTLTNAPDGMYLCFIDIQHSADSYFGFFIKNNGNILSLNDRIDETFKGQHCNSRNGRWSENKADQIFPYDYVIDYSDHDYKGYSHTYKIDENKLDLFKTGEEVFLPLVIAMILILQLLIKLNKDDYDIKYVDSLFKINIPLLSTDKNELMVIENNNIVKYNNSINLEFDYNKIMDGSALDEFDFDTNRRGDYVAADNHNQIFVDLYGEGFKIQPTVLSTQKLIGTGNYSYVPEFVGSEHRMRVQAFVDIRKQLADYIKNKIYEEYTTFGGITAVRDWFSKLVNDNLDMLKKLAVEHYIATRTGKAHNYTGGWQPSEHDKGYYISEIDDTSYVSYEYHLSYMANNHDRRRDVYLDLENEKPCNIFFVFRPFDYLGIEELFNTTVPKIVKGWSKESSRTHGNSNLDATDPVETINTPFDYYESQHGKYKDERSDTFYSFVCAIGFSKSGFKSYAKSIGYDLNKILKSI